MKIKQYGLIALLLIGSSAQAQLMDKIKTRSGGDPGNPTDLFTRYDSHFDLRFDSKNYQIGNLWSFAFAFNNKHQVNANAPLAFSSQSNKLGMGDTEIGYATMPLLDSTAFLSALGFRMQVSIPTGSYSNNLGIGAVRLNPGIIANFKLSERFFMLPELKYIYTSKVLQSVPDMTVNRSMHGFDSSFKIVFKTTKDSWLWLTPIVTTFDLENSNPEFELEILYGVKILNRIGLTAYIRNNFNTDTYIFQFINSIYF
jgi:hypothetical protein